MSLTSQLKELRAGTKRDAHNSSKRPRIYGELSTPEPFSFTDLAHEANKANQSARNKTPAGTRNGFGNNARIVGFGINPSARRKVRKAHRLAGWIRRAQLSAKQAGQAAEVAADAAQSASVAASEQKPAGIAAKVSRFFGRVFGRKGGR